MKKRYIGVTGFTDRQEVGLSLCGLPHYQMVAQVMVGVLVSSKTLRGEQNKWSNRYPAVDKISEIFPKHCNVLNVIHYHTEELENLEEELDKLMELGGANLDGIQLNIAWPSPKCLTEFRKKHSKTIIL